MIAITTSNSTRLKPPAGMANPFGLAVDPVRRVDNRPLQTFTAALPPKACEPA